VAAPVLSFFISKWSPILFSGYKFGFELLIVNGMLVVLGLFLLSKKPENKM